MFQLRPLLGSQTKEFQYLEDKASNKVITLTYPDAAIIPCTLTCTYTRTLPNQVFYLKGSSMDSFSLGLLPKLDFTQVTHQKTLRELADLHNFYVNTLFKLKRIKYQIL